MVMKNSIQKTGDGSLSCNLVIKVLVYDYPHQKNLNHMIGIFLFLQFKKPFGVYVPKGFYCL